MARSQSSQWSRRRPLQGKALQFSGEPNVRSWPQSGSTLASTNICFWDPSRHAAGALGIPGSGLRLRATPVAQRVRRRSRRPLARDGETAARLFSWGVWRAGATRVNSSWAMRNNGSLISRDPYSSRPCKSTSRTAGFRVDCCSTSAALQMARSSPVSTGARDLRA